MAIPKPIWSEDGLTLSNVLLKNKNTLGTYNVVTQWYDGTSMDDSKLDDDLVYVKYQGKYLVQNFEYDLLLEKDTIAELRNLSTLEILLLRMGVYKSIQLNGYYEKYDTPTPINYFISTNPNTDDGGSLIDVGDIKLEHKFVESFSPKYYGIVSSATLDQSVQLSNYAKYCDDNNIYEIDFLV